MKKRISKKEYYEQKAEEGLFSDSEIEAVRAKLAKYGKKAYLTSKEKAIAKSL